MESISSCLALNTRNITNAMQNGNGNIHINAEPQTCATVAHIIFSNLESTLAAYAFLQLDSVAVAAVSESKRTQLYTKQYRLSCASWLDSRASRRDRSWFPSSCSTMTTETHAMQRAAYLQLPSTRFFSGFACNFSVVGGLFEG